ncbi:MAG: ACT domain-containing protein [Candidatus Dadabacteria bacterium]|nr:MAG: ACT domain-containing protein [Candidatus Dadabacteria bacterium]
MTRVGAWKAELDGARRALAEGRIDPGGLADVLDRIVRELAEDAGWHRPGRAVVALGGYGRRDMAPRSDVDLLFLTERHRGEPDVEAVLYPLWDLGLEVGHALRTPRDCRDVARTDLTAATALLDARLLCGDPDLLARGLRAAGAAPRPSRRTRAWARAVVADVGTRRTRFGEVSHLLEPHVKEGWGGLRDAHAASWVLACLGLDPRQEIPRLASGPRALEGARFLARVRAALHAAAGRKTDHLTFEHHEPVARLVTPGFPPGELLARVHRAARGIAALWEEVAQAFPRPPGRPRPPTGFSSAEEARTALSIRRRGGPAPSPIALDRLAASPGEVRRPALLRVLGEGLRRRAPVHLWFRALLDRELLGDVDPLLARAAEAVPYDARHAFTVGAHGVESLAAFDRLWLGALEDREPWLTRVAGGLAAPWIVRVAALAHDLGKCLDPDDHARAGAAAARRLGLTLGLSPPEAEEAARLVALHHALPRLAFRQDPEDPRTAAEAWEIAGTPERLDALVVLAYADLAATHPGPVGATWTPWVRGLLLALHARAHATPAAPPLSEADLRKRLAARIGRPDAGSLVHEVPRAELLQVPLDLLERLVRMTARAPSSDDGLWEVVTPATGPVEVLGVIPHPPPWALSAASSALSRLGFDVRMFQVHAWSRGCLHLWFRCLPPDPPPPVSRVRQALAQALGAGRPGPRRPRLPDRRAEATPVATRVSLTHGSPVHSILEVVCRDRAGLLADLTAALDDLGLRVTQALVTTQGPQARDVFHVQDLLGGRIEGEDKRRKVIDRVHEAISSLPSERS